MEKKKIDKFCLFCGKLLNEGHEKFCNNKCQAEYNYEMYIEKWKNGIEDGIRGKFQLSAHINRYIKEKYNNKCCICGWAEVNQYTGKIPLEIHHIDGDYKNNSEDNLMLLCPNCHSLTSNYKNANNHFGRKDRSVYYETQ